MPFTQAGGVRIAYESRGTGDMVLFLHGADATRAVWAAQLEAFSRDYRAAALDFRGHGDSDRSETVTHQAYARDINAVLDALVVPRAHLVGVGMGSLAAVQFALDFPARARSLTLSGLGQEPAWVEVLPSLARIQAPTQVLEAQQELDAAVRTFIAAH